MSNAHLISVEFGRAHGAQTRTYFANRPALPARYVQNEALHSVREALPIETDPAQGTTRMVALLDRLDARARDQLLADLSQIHEDPEEDPIVRMARGQRAERDIPAADVHAAFVIQQAALRHELTAQTLGSEQVARLLGVTRQTVHNYVKAGRLLAFSERDRLRFPAWQFDASAANGVVAGLEDVLAALQLSPIAATRWFSRANSATEGRNPIDALRVGDVDKVVRAAVAAQSL